MTTSVLLNVRDWQVYFQCLILNSDLEENCHSFAYNPQKDSVRLLKTSWLSQRDRKN